MIVHALSPVYDSDDDAFMHYRPASVIGSVVVNSVASLAIASDASLTINSIFNSVAAQYLTLMQ